MLIWLKYGKLFLFNPQIVLGVIQFFVVSLGGLAIGVILGALTSFITKYTEHCRGGYHFILKNLHFVLGIIRLFVVSLGGLAMGWCFNFLYNKAYITLQE